MIVGFPGETEADFEQLRDFVSEFRFERLGVFTYSHEEGTPAFDLPGAVDPEVAERRRAEIMALQRQIAVEQNTALVGQTMEVLVDGRHPDPDAGAERAFVGRTARDAPEVDGAVYLAEAELGSGDLVLARIEDVEDYDLRARLVSSDK